jgi:ribonuclease E
VVIDEALAHAEHQIDRVSNTPHEAARTWEGPSPSGYSEAEIADDAHGDDDDVEDEEDEEERQALAAPRAEPEDEDQEPGAAAGEEDEGPRRSGRRRRRGRRGGEPRVQSEAAAPSQPAPREGESEAEAGARRRRRGRRGGRRLREEARPADAYGWSWPARLSGEDPYEWRGPPEVAAPPSAGEVPAPFTAHDAPPATRAQALLAPALEAPTAGQDEEIWVELPSEPETPKRPRRSRAKAKPAAPDEAANDVAAAAPEEPVQAEPAPAAYEQPPALAPVEAAAQPASEPVRSADDPAEISAPATSPRRGWWRSGA